MIQPLLKTQAAAQDSDRLARSVIAALAAAPRFEAPYVHWMVQDMLPEATVQDLIDLPFPPLAIDGVSGRRELHNDARIYFDAGNMATHPVCRAVAEAFQAAETVAAVETHMGTSLEGCFLRVEYARDTEGFWLEPHTDLGVKRFTMLYYLNQGPEQDDLGTDIYADPKTWTKRSPFTRNAALVFVPSDRTWHGFERRPMPGLRKSVIINYVTTDWRQREQLAFPQSPVRAA